MYFISRMVNQFSFTYDSAWTAVGGFSEPSKMPCYGWSISARRCNVGAKLVGVKDSVCAGCYALKGRYTFPNVQNALERRLAASKKPEFVPAFIYLLKVLTPSYFRLFDSGDLQDEKMLKDFVAIAEACPTVRFWLPTKEYGIVQSFVDAGGVIPSNLNIRLSGYMIDKEGPVSLAKRIGATISEVVRGEDFTCPSSKQGNKCLDCRACWDKDTFTVKYHKH